MSSYAGKTYSYLNIYSDSEVESDLDRIAQGCQSLPLTTFLPYHLYHTELFHLGVSVETVFLLSGSDQKIHMYREAKNTHTFIEEEHMEDFFPEMVDLPGIVSRLQCVHFDQNHRRLTAFGCQNGYVDVVLVNVDTKEVLKSFQIQHDSPISSINLFRLVSFTSSPAVVSSLLGISPETSPVNDFHLLVASSLEPAVVYSNILEREFADTLLLPESDSFDSVLCSLATDVDFDGENEIILGTYGQELLVYKLQCRQPKSRKSSCNFPSSCSDATLDSSQCNGTSLRLSGNRNLPPGSLLDKEFSLICRRSMPEPVMALEEVDLVSNGLNEIAVLMLKELHVLQHDLVEISEMCIARMNKSYEPVNHSSESESSNTVQFSVQMNDSPIKPSTTDTPTADTSCCTPVMENSE